MEFGILKIGNGNYLTRK